MKYPQKAEAPTLSQEYPVAPPVPDPTFRASFGDPNKIQRDAIEEVMWRNKGKLGDPGLMSEIIRQLLSDKDLLTLQIGSMEYWGVPRSPEAIASLERERKAKGQA